MHRRPPVDRGAQDSGHRSENNPLTRLHRSRSRSMSPRSSRSHPTRTPRPQWLLAGAVAIAVGEAFLDRSPRPRSSCVFAAGEAGAFDHDDAARVAGDRRASRRPRLRRCRGPPCAARKRPDRRDWAHRRAGAVRRSDSRRRSRGDTPSPSSAIWAERAWGRWSSGRSSSKQSETSPSASRSGSTARRTPGRTSRRHLRTADITVGNLETSVSTRGMRRGQAVRIPRQSLFARAARASGGLRRADARQQPLGRLRPRCARRHGALGARGGHPADRRGSRREARAPAGDRRRRRPPRGVPRLLRRQPTRFSRRSHDRRNRARGHSRDRDRRPCRAPPQRRRRVLLPLGNRAASRARRAANAVRSPLACRRGHRSSSARIPTSSARSRGPPRRRSSPGASGTSSFLRRA